MKALIADKFEDEGINELRDVGYDVEYDPALQGDALRDAVARTRCTVLIVRGTKVTADVIEAGDDLGLVIRAGAGYNTIDVAAASRRGIPVANCPGKNAVAVAELTIGLILALDRRIVENVNDLRNGRWSKKEYSKARGLKGRTLGVVGTGEIGRAVIRRALALEMNVVAWSRSLTDQTAAELGVTRCGSPAEVAERCDVLTIHLAAAPETKGLINAEVLRKLRPGSYLINTARAEVIDHDALASAIRERKLRVGLDVYPNEPSTAEGPFPDTIVHQSLDASASGNQSRDASASGNQSRDASASGNQSRDASASGSSLAGIVYGTHHIGASTDQAQAAIAAEAVRIARVFAETGEVPNCVNIQTRSPARWQMIVRHYNKVGVLASVLEKISHANINVEEMANTMYEGQRAAVATIRLDDEPGQQTIAEIAGMKDKVIKVEVKAV